MTGIVDRKVIVGTIIAIGAACSNAAQAQTAAATIQLGNLFAQLESQNGSQPNYVRINRAALGLSEDVLAYRVRTDWSQGSPTGSLGGYSVDAGVVFFDDVTLQAGATRASSSATAYNAQFGPQAVNGLTFVGRTRPLFNTLNAVDFVYTNSSYGEFGSAYFNNTSLELFTASGISTQKYQTGAPAANRPSAINLGTFNTGAISIDFSRGAPADFALFGADGTIIAFGTESGGVLTFGDGDLVVDSDRTGAIFFDGGLGNGTYYLAASAGNLIFNNGFSVSEIDPTAGVIGGAINGQEFSTALGAGQFQFYEFTVIPTPASLAALGFGLSVVARRRRS